MPAEYLIRFHGDYFAGSKRSWWAERLDTETDLESTLREIEDQVAYGRELEAVLLVEHTDTGWTGTDFTESARALLHQREQERHVEAFHAGGHNFASLQGYLETRDWNFPPKRDCNAQEAA